MKIFKTYQCRWWEIGMLKVAVVLIGIAIGATWPEVFAPYAGYFAVLGVILGIYLAFAWLKD